MQVQSKCTIIPNHTLIHCIALLAKSAAHYMHTTNQFGEREAIGIRSREDGAQDQREQARRRAIHAAACAMVS